MSEFLLHFSAYADRICINGEARCLLWQSASNVQNAKAPTFKYLEMTVKVFPSARRWGGAMLSGFAVGTGIGALVGFAGKNGKYEVFCLDCGKRFKVK